MDHIDSLKKRYKPIVLLILDGWGLSPSWGGNAIAMGNPVNFNQLWRDYPHQVLQALGKVADPKTGRVGSSEIGHASIGTGRLILQDLTEINQAIADGSFFQNPVLQETYQKAKSPDCALHLLGLLSDAGIHSHLGHLFALMEGAKKEGVSKVYLHLVTDGYDTESYSALGYLQQLEEKIRQLGIGKIATMIGRYYAMDRDNNWDRIARAYEAQVFGKGYQSLSARNAISEAYKLGYNDATLPPFVIVQDNEPVAKIKAEDVVIFFNFRADRARQLSRAYRDKNCFRSLGLWRKYPLLPLHFVTLTSYRLRNLDLHPVFPSAIIETSLAKILSDHGLKQLHLAETEKYSHVTYFFNGGIEEPFSNEDRLFIPSLKVSSYSQAPQMSLPRLTKVLIDQIKNKKYDFILVNIPNVDMVGHSGDILATQKATQMVDQAIGEISPVVLKKGGALIITADHGNAEQMAVISRQIGEKAHSLNPVPFILVLPDNKKNLLASALTPTKGFLPEIISSEHSLADIAPTILQILSLAKPIEMTGKSLLGRLK